MKLIRYLPMLLGIMVQGGGCRRCEAFPENCRMYCANCFADRRSMVCMTLFNRYSSCQPVCGICHSTNIVIVPLTKVKVKDPLKKR